MRKEKKTKEDDGVGTLLTISCLFRLTVPVPCSLLSSSSVFNVHVEKRLVSGVDTSSLRHGVMTENMVIVCGTDDVMFRTQIVPDR